MPDLEIDALDQELSFTNSLPTFVRILMFVSSFLPFYGFYDLVLAPRWTGYFNFIFLFFLCIGLGALSVGVPLVLASLSGAESVEFDARQKTIRHIRAASILPGKEWDYPVSRIKATKLVRTEDDSEVSYRSELQFIQGKSLKLKRFTSEAAATAYHEQLQQWLSHVTQRTVPQSVENV
jgi:hypothetical protein